MSTPKRKPIEPKFWTRRGRYSTAGMKATDKRVKTGGGGKVSEGFNVPVYPAPKDPAPVLIFGDNDGK